MRKTLVISATLAVDHDRPAEVAEPGQADPEAGQADPEGSLDLDLEASIIVCGMEADRAEATMDMVAWPGGRNVRDLGGRALRAGGYTPFGRVFRSAAPEHLTDDGWIAAKAAGVRTVVDLRNAPAETRRTADHPIIRPESLHGLAFVPAPTEDPEDAEFLRVCGPHLDHPCSWIDNARLAPARIAATLRAIARADGAVLVHCAGGRDRTGMISAMVLHIAGATDEAIIEDYAAGWRGAGTYAGHAWVYNPDRESWQRHRYGPTEAGEVECQIADRVLALREWIATFDGAALMEPAEVRAIKSRLAPVG